MNVVFDTNIWISFLIGHVLDEMEDLFLLNSPVPEAPTTSEPGTMTSLF